MNAPERFESFVLPDGVKKVEMIPDPKIPNCVTFGLRMEDHTTANILKYKIIENKNVVFAGYTRPHPLEHRVLIRVQTEGNVKPIEVFLEAIQSLLVEYDNIRSKFEMEVARVKAMTTENPGQNMFGEFGMNQERMGGAAGQNMFGGIDRVGGIAGAGAGAGIGVGMGAGSNLYGELDGGQTHHDDVDLDF